MRSVYRNVTSVAKMNTPKDLLLRWGIGIVATLFGVYFRSFFMTDVGMHTFIVGASIVTFVALWIAGRRLPGAFWLALIAGVTTALSFYTILLLHSAFAGFAVFVGVGCLLYFSGFFKRYGLDTQKTGEEVENDNQKDG